jgi:hypothetical protein
MLPGKSAAVRRVRRAVGMPLVSDAGVRRDRGSMRRLSDYTLEQLWRVLQYYERQAATTRSVDRRDRATRQALALRNELMRREATARGGGYQHL